MQQDDTLSALVVYVAYNVYMAIDAVGNKVRLQRARVVALAIYTV